MKIRNFSLALLGAVALVLGMSILTATFAATSFSYTVTDLGTLGGSSSQAYGINDTGQVVGNADTSNGLSHAFLWDQGTMNDLGTVDGYSYSSAYKINNVGQAVGSAYIEPINRTDNSPRLALLWAQGAQSPPQDLGSLGGNRSDAYGINNRGDVVGLSRLDNTTYNRAFLWSKGKMRNLGTLSNTEGCSPYPSYIFGASVNNKRQIVGPSEYCAFLWEKGTMRAISSDWSDPRDINDRGQIVGNGNDGKATLWNLSDGTRKSLGTLGRYISWAHGINNRGRVVGGTYDPRSGDMLDISRNPYHAFLWINDTIKDLNSLIPADSGWELQTAQDINNFGKIVGYGKHNGHTKAFLLTPTWTTN